MLNRELEVTLNLAFKEARARRHEFMTVEHLLLALLDNEAAARWVAGRGTSNNDGVCRRTSLNGPAGNAGPGVAQASDDSSIHSGRRHASIFGGNRTVFKLNRTKWSAECRDRKRKLMVDVAAWQ